MPAVPPTLLSYRQDVQRLCGDVKQERFNPFDLDIYINEARRQVAAESQCVRRLTPSTSGLDTITPTAVGAGYTIANVTVGPPDVPGIQAVVTANIVGGAVTSYNVVTAGTGYMFPPSVAVSGNGTGAAAVAILQYTSQLTTEQERFDFSSVPIATIFPGCLDILAVLSISVIWQNVKYVGNRVSFSKFQALVASYTSGSFLYTPFWFAQYGQGTDGSFYLYPNPDQNYPAQLDCLMLPDDLDPESTVPEVIPRPFSNAVPYFASWAALQSLADPVFIPLADRYWNPTTGGIAGAFMRRARAFSQPSVVSSWYGRNLS